MRGRIFARGRTRTIAAGCLLLCGCNIIDGLQSAGDDLLDPDPTGVANSGRQLATGHHSHLAFDYTDETGAQVVSLRHDEGGRKLSITSLGGSSSCVVGPAVGFKIFAQPDDAPGPVIPYLESLNEQRRGTLRFVDHSCTQLGEPIEEAKLPSSLREDPRGFLVRSGPQLLDVDPWSGQTRVLASTLSHSQWTDDHLWLIDGGELVVFDQARNELGRLGSSVTEVVPASSGPSGAYVDVAALYLLEDLREDPRLVAEDVCGVRRWSFSGRWYSYFSPCGSGRLVLREVDTDEQHLFSDGVTAVARIAKNAGGGFSVLYLTGGSRLGTLWLQESGEDPIQIAENADIRSATLPPPGYRTHLRAGCNDDRCDLIEWRRDEGTTTVVAENVAREFDSPYVLADFDGTVGDLMVWAPSEDLVDGPPDVPADFELTRYASGVPVHHPIPATTALHDLPTTAFIMESDGEVGTLALTDEHIAMLHESALAPPVPEPRRVGDGVPLWGFSFLDTYPGLLYLSEFDPSAHTGTLRTLNLELGADLRISDGVSAFAEWMYVGIVYAVPTGERAGIWYARFN